MIRLVVTKVEPNPRYDPDRRYQTEMPTIETELLRCELGDEAYNAVRKAVIEAMP